MRKLLALPVLVLVLSACGSSPTPLIPILVPRSVSIEIPSSRLWTDATGV